MKHLWLACSFLLDQINLATFGEVTEQMDRLPLVKLTALPSFGGHVKISFSVIKAPEAFERLKKLCHLRWTLGHNYTNLLIRIKVINE